MSDEEDQEREQLRLKASLGRMGGSREQSSSSSSHEVPPHVESGPVESPASESKVDTLLAVFGTGFCFVVGLVLSVLLYSLVMAWSYQQAFAHADFESRPSLWKAFPTIAKSNIQDLVSAASGEKLRSSWNQDLEKIQLVLERRPFLGGTL